MSTSQKLTIPTQPTYQSNATSLKEGLKNIRRSTPSVHRAPVLEKQLETLNQGTKFEAVFSTLASKLKEFNLTNMSCSTKSYIVQKLTSIEIKVNHIRQQQQIPENSTNNADVLDRKEVDDVLDRLEKFKHHLSERNNCKKWSMKFTRNYKLFCMKFRSSRNLIQSNHLCRKRRSPLIDLLTHQEIVMGPHLEQAAHLSCLNALRNSK